MLSPTKPAATRTSTAKSQPRSWPKPANFSPPRQKSKKSTSSPRNCRSKGIAHARHLSIRNKKAAHPGGFFVPELFTSRESENTSPTEQTPKNLAQQFTAPKSHQANQPRTQQHQRSRFRRLNRATIIQSVRTACFLIHHERNRIRSVHQKRGQLRRRKNSFGASQAANRQRGACRIRTAKIRRRDLDPIDPHRRRIIRQNVEIRGRHRPAQIKCLRERHRRSIRHHDKTRIRCVAGVGK